MNFRRQAVPPYTWGSSMDTSTKALVVTVGGTPEPITTTIVSVQPDIVVAITSPESRTGWDTVLESLKLKDLHPACREIPVGDPNDLATCFNACHEAFDSLKREHADSGLEVVAGPTGGTKLMSAALLLAATEVGAEVLYIAGERDKGGVGVVKTGTERPLTSVHPYDLFSRSAKQRLCEEFNSYRFESAIATCGEIAARSQGRAPVSSTFKALQKVCDGYRLWDMFQHGTARQKIKSGLGSLERLETEDVLSLERLTDFCNAAEANCSHLEQLPREKKPDPSVPLVLDLLANAKRRAEEGKHDDAVARLYRTLEMVAQVAFIDEFGCSTTKFPLKKLDAKVRSVLFRDCDELSTPDIGARKAFRVLEMIGHRWGQKYAEDEKHFRDVLESRNESILAHGTVSLDEKAFDRLYGYITEAFELMPDVEFPKLDFPSVFTLGMQHVGMLVDD
jgi:CRISPR-associated protein (TIGR02710 family)